MTVLQKTTDRGYGQQHQKLRADLIAQMVDGDPCSRCGDAMYHTDPIELDHTDDRSGYLGLSHRRCNRRSNPSLFALSSGNCPVCGKPKGYRSATCGRRCGWVLRKQRVAQE